MTKGDDLTGEAQTDELSDDEQFENMTKMEHYKKRLIHQHEKPTLVSSPQPLAAEDEEIPSPSSVSSSSSMHSIQSTQQDKKKEEVVQSKVARKRAVCRSKFRHQNLELFKLGNSIPTSLCKTKEPYNICAEKNLQMCCQSQQNGKKDENSVSITEAIINSMEGSKKKDALLWRSMSLNSETKNEKQNASAANINNTMDVSKNVGNGRHILPAIVPEIPERRKSKPTLSSDSGELKNNSEENVERAAGGALIIKKAAPVSISKRKPITKRRKTVIGSENVETEVQSNEESERDIPETNNQETDKLGLARRMNSAPTGVEVSQSAPMNLSVKNGAQQSIARDPTNVNLRNPYNDPRLNSANKNQYLTRSYTAAQAAAVPNVYYQNNYTGVNFPEIQQQMMRMENPNPPMPPDRPAVQRPEPYYQSNSLLDNNEEEIAKTIIQLVKSSMNHSFSIEILLVLNKWYLELKAYLMQPSISKRIKTSISRTLNEVILYISDKLFGSPCNIKSKGYVEEMLQVPLGQHKELLTNLLPLLSTNYKDEQWMRNFLKLLSHTSAALPPPNTVARHNNARTPSTMPTNTSIPPPSLMYPTPVTAHSFAPPHPSQNYFMPPKDYFMNHPQNYQPPPPPYGAFRYGNALSNTFPGNYLANADQPHHGNGVMGPRGKYPEDVMESQRNKQPGARGYPNVPRSYPQLENSNVSPPKLVRPDKLHLADNRCIPPKYGPTLDPAQNNPTRQNSKDRLDIIPIGPPNTLASVQNNVPGTNFEQLSMEKAPSRESSNGTDINSQNRVIVQMNAHNAQKTTDIAESRATNCERLEPNESTPKEAHTSEQFGVSDVEELLRTNVIFNNSRSVNEAQKSPVLNAKVGEIDVGKSGNSITKNISTEKLVNTSKKENIRILSSTVIVKDKSMEITRGNSNQKLESIIIRNSNQDFTDITFERIERRITNGDSVTPDATDAKTIGAVTSGNGKSQNPETCRQDVLIELLTRPSREVVDTQEAEVINIDTDEELFMDKGQKMPQPIELPPRLIKLDDLKRKEGDGNKAHQDKRLKVDTSSANLVNEIVVIDDEEKDLGNQSVVVLGDTQKTSDYNQNYIVQVDQNVNRKDSSTSAQAAEKSNPRIVNREVPIVQVTPSRPPSSTAKNPVVTDTSSSSVKSRPFPKAPIIEDISSDEETLEPHGLYSTYESKVSGDPRRILRDLEVSHCTLIEDSVKLIENAAKQNFEKPLVYSRSIAPHRARRHTTDTDGIPQGSGCSGDPIRSPAKERRSLASVAKLKEDLSSVTCHIKVKNTAEIVYRPQPRNLDRRRFTSSPPHQVPLEAASPVPSPHFIEDVGYPKTSPVNSYPPNFKSPNESVPGSPVGPSPTIVPRSPIVPALKNSGVDWKNWFADEQKKGFFNFSRSQSIDSGSVSRRQSVETISSVGSDYCPKFSMEDNYYEIKIDSKPYRIKKSVYEKIPKGKLCYVRETNTFIRYFDDNQMELFISNLNIGEGSLIATDLLKQIKGRVEGFSDVDTSLGHYEASGKSEVINVSKDVNFSTEDHLSDPELYVEEVEKVQRFVPKDFYGFYKFVTGYQIVNHHPPISFQTFLTMHNTNGIRGLFKNYVNTLIEGRNVL